MQNLHGWKITTLVTSFIVVFLIFNFGLAGWNATAIKHAIDATGRSSLILFGIAFTPQVLKAFGLLRSPAGRSEIGAGSV